MNPKVSLEQAESHLNEIKNSTKNQLIELQDICLDKNFNESASKIYLTKYRIKSTGSLYLKTKRKNKSLDEINDYGGLRLLCLFEDDIFDVHRGFIKMLHDKHYALKCCSVYNWNTKSTNILKQDIDKYFTLHNKDFEKIKRTSGYKSVHYVVKQSGLKAEWIEVQLRTLVQDVWGELAACRIYQQGRNTIIAA